MNKSKSILLFSGIIVIVLIIYFPALYHDFLYQWDDQWMVINPYTQEGFSCDNLWAVFTDFYHGQYAPLNELSYMVIYKFFGYDPFWFHASSIFLHIINTFLVFIFIRYLLSTSGRIEQSKIHLLAFLTAFLFAINPVNVEPVAWISASKILIFTCYYLAALLLYLHYTQTRKVVYYLLTLFFFCFSFLSKEQAVTLPLCLLLLDWFIQRNMRDENIYFEKLPFFALALLFGLITILSQRGGGDTPQFPILQRLVFACYVLFESVVKSLIPINLYYLYPYPMQVGEAVPVRFWMYPVIIGVLFHCFYLFRKNILLTFTVLFVVIHLSVVSHIIPLSRYAIFADRYSYIVSIGLMLYVSYGIIGLYNFLKQKKLSGIAIALFVCYSLYFCMYSSVYAGVWKDSDSVKSKLNTTPVQQDEQEKQEMDKNIKNE